MTNGFPSGKELPILSMSGDRSVLCPNCSPFVATKSPSVVTNVSSSLTCFCTSSIGFQMTKTRARQPP